MKDGYLPQFLKTFRLLAMLLVGVSCTTPEMQPVRVLPDFVNAAIRPGDTVIVSTLGHEDIEFVVTEVTDTSLHSADREILLIEIAELHKVSSERPPTPCGNGEPLGCSLPLLVSLASKEHNHYKEEFYAACEQHDYCYRHGVRTYGLDREYCDTEFLVNMQMSCPVGSSSTFGSVMEAMNDSVESRAVCMQVASDFQMVVQDYGEKNFEVQGSTYCEYNGPP
jgi:hypothetical protein